MRETVISDEVPGHPMRIGDSFTALHWSEDFFAGAVDPVVMVDHFHMTAATFPPHPHAGISAVTYVFEDSASPHVNYDSLGNHQPIHPGALHWFVAGRGAVHTEQPEGPGAHVHALQIFVNLPASKKHLTPCAVHLEPAEIPEYTAPGVRVRVVLGQSQGLAQPATARLPEPFTLLDGFLEAGAAFGHSLPAAWSAMVCLVSGRVDVEVAGRRVPLSEGHAIGITRPGQATEAGLPLRVLAQGGPAHWVLLSGPALREPLVKQGPFVMNTLEQMRESIASYQQGLFGQLRWPG